ncbi:MAG: gliding motility protein GldM [Bacteroidaceae bacterium]|nr:gliding motility protein GldM [Bacteroidaceae bacterium]
MSGIKKKKISPRQKMINLMYLVLMVMLALNVSTDVLNGFSIVEKSLNRTTQNSSRENTNIYSEFESQMKQNPDKVRSWNEKAQYVRQMSDSLFDLADKLKREIVREADGKNGDIENIRNKENLEAATQVMLTDGRGKTLYDAIVSYRSRILQFIEDPEQKEIIQSNLTTEVSQKDKLTGRNWQQAMFESMPVAAATTLLTKLQSDVRYAEGEVLHALIKNIDVKDVRVNELNAYVIPNAQTIVQGDRFSARIIMAAVDTTQQPRIYIGGKEVSLKNGLYEFNCGNTGDFNFAGYMEMTDRSGETLRRNFSQKYTVVAPSATVSADLMNVLYAGYDNPMSVSVPGVANQNIVATMSGGNLTSTGPGKYVARPTKIGEDAVITITSKAYGGSQKMGEFKFRVRRLPDPTAYIAYNDAEGNPVHYVGGRGFSKSILLSVDGIGAAIDDGLLNIPFQVTGFETVFFDNMGNAIPEVSTSDKFTERQKSIFSRLSRGKRFYISRVQATGPDGTTRTLPQSLEVIVN